MLKFLENLLEAVLINLSYGLLLENLIKQIAAQIIVTALTLILWDDSQVHSKSRQF